MIKKLLLTTIMLVGSSHTYTSEGFESAFAQALKKKKKKPSTDQINNPPVIAEAYYAKNANNYKPLATVQITEEKQYFSMHPEIQQMIRDQQKREGTFDKNLLRVSSFLIQSYQSLQNKRTPFTIDSIRQDELDLVPHLHSVYNHLNNTTQSSEVIRIKEQIQETIAKISN